MSYFLQLWPHLKYGLGVNAPPLEDLLGVEEREGDRLLGEGEKPDRPRKYSLFRPLLPMLPQMGKKVSMPNVAITVMPSVCAQ